jgi:hypothetical protein
MKIQFLNGSLPEFWDRRAVFLANLLSLFFGNQEETDALRREIGTLETYGNRLLPILNLLFKGRPNLLVLQRAPDPALLAYFVDRLGLELPELLLAPGNAYERLLQQNASGDPTPSPHLHRIAGHSAEWMDGFVTDENLAGLARRTGKKTVSTESGSRRGNNKRLLHDYLVAEGLPAFETRMAKNRSEVPACLSALADLGYRQAVLKSPIGASGIGLIRVATDGDDDVPDYLFHEGACLVQGWLDDGKSSVQPIGSPSVQVFVADDSVTLYDITDQILSNESIHEGNVAPPPCFLKAPGLRDELLRQSSKACEWLHAQGYRGTGSLDFHVVKHNGAIEVRICEINARVTGATYPSVLARHFAPEKAWLMRNLRFHPPIEGARLLNLLDEKSMLYHPGNELGILPINFNLDEQGHTAKGQFLCLAESTEAAGRLLDAARHVLPVALNYDRD